MKAGDAFEIIGNRLQNDYKLLKFKYSKSNKWVKKSTKRFNYYIIMISFSENIPDKDVGLKICFTVHDKTLSDDDNQLFYIDLWKIGNCYNVATEALLNDAYDELKIEIEKYLIPFIDKFEDKINEYKKEWIKYGFLHEFGKFEFSANLQFINNVYGRESAKECLKNYLNILDKNNQKTFGEKYLERINENTSFVFGSAFDKEINITIFLDVCKLKLLDKK